MEGRGLPSGQLTFLFTDIEGSTWLLQHLGESFDEVLHEHNRLLREAWRRHDGHEVSTEGDAFFVVFEDTARALHAALDAQRMLGGHPWPPDGGVRVRMGLHTGEARLYGQDYVGLPVHQAARIASAAHGGQILISQTTLDAAGDLSPGISFVDLGPHRLKDLAQPLRLHQLAHPDIPAEFPAPRTLSVMPNNFPVQATSFVGRERDIAEVRGLLDEARLVTLTGAGGAGKTRLALQAGAELIDEFPEGAWLVDLAPGSDPDIVASTVADVLGVREQPGRAIVDTLADQLVARRMLVVLDNCEHLIDACAKLVHVLLSSCPQIRVLATSREALNVSGEVVWRLPSLSLPEPDESDVGVLAGMESVRLFVQRARAARPGFDLTAANAQAVTQICCRLDGLPLAIELAAARVRAMGVQDIADRLDDRFRLLTGGSRLALPRQRTLEATVSWSYELLSEVERICFDRMGVFAGGCTLEAAEFVCSDEDLDSFEVIELLGRLVDRSLIVAEEDPLGRGRYRMLETLRQFARQRLVERGEMDGLRGRHLAWFTRFAEAAPTSHGWMMPLEVRVEEDNLRVAQSWALETGDEGSLLRIIGSVRLGHFAESARLFARVLPPSADVSPRVAGKALFNGVGLAFMMGDWTRGAEWSRASAEANRAAEETFLTALSLIYEGGCRWGLGDRAAAKELAREGLAVARSGGDRMAEARGLLILAWLASEEDPEEAEAVAAEGERVSSELEDVFDLGHMREVGGFIRCVKGDLHGGALLLSEAARLFRDIQRNCASHVLETCAAWASMSHRLELGAELLGAAERLREETGDKPRPWEGVPQRWLPRIAEALDPVSFETAYRRGASRSHLDALSLAEDALRG